MGVKIIDKGAFFNCISLRFLHLPDGVTEIGKNAFCLSGLQSINIPSSVKRIGRTAFYCGDDDMRIDITGIEAWCMIEYKAAPMFDFGCGWERHAPYHLFLNGEEVTELVVPGTVESIDDYHFPACKSLTSARVPSSVTRIGNHAFRDCVNLRNVTMSNVESIGEYAFNGCDIQTFDAGSSVKRIGSYALGLCPVRAVRCLTATPPQLSELAFTPGGLSITP